jgi:hypothetical protein
VIHELYHDVLGWKKFVFPPRGWPSTVREYLEKHPERNFVGGWVKNPKRHGAF